MVLLPIAGIQLNVAEVLLKTSACITGAGAAGCGTPETTAEAGPVPIWLTARTLKKYVVPFFKLGTLTTVSDEPVFGIAAFQGPLGDVAC